LAESFSLIGIPNGGYARAPELHEQSRYVIRSPGSTPSCVEPSTDNSAVGCSDSEGGNRCQFSPPVNDHPLDLAGALEDREDSGRAVSFRRSAARIGLWYWHRISEGGGGFLPPRICCRARGVVQEGAANPWYQLSAEYCAEVHRRDIFADLPGHAPGAAMAHGRAAHGPGAEECPWNPAGRCRPDTAA
jgi:hypothetical protein